MSTSLFSLPIELRESIYQHYISHFCNQESFAVVGNRMIPPILMYGNRQIHREFYPLWAATIQANIFRARNLRAVVVDFDFKPLLDYIWALNTNAPLLSHRGKIHVVLVFTNASLIIGKITAQARRKDMLEWTDFLFDLQQWDQDAPKCTHTVREPPPEMGFERSELLWAMAGCPFEMPKFAEVRIERIKAMRRRLAELEECQRDMVEPTTVETI